MSNVLPIYNPKFRAFDSNGDPLAGGKLYTYTANSSTPRSTYTTRAGNVANANPVVLDANGEADVWGTPNVSYKFELQNSLGVVQWTVDNVPTLPDDSLTPLLLGDGLVTAPSLAFISSPESGLYLPGEDNPAMAAGGVKIQDWTVDGSRFDLGITVGQSQTNTAAITSTGNGSAPGVDATGGLTDAPGGKFTGGGTNGAGVTGFGKGNGRGGAFTGAASTTADGVLGTGGSTSGTGVHGVGGGTGVGGTFANGTAATGGTRRDAVTLVNGDINLDSVAYPTSTTAMKNRLSPGNLPKAWGSFVYNNGSAPTVTAGFNISGPTDVTSGGQARSRFTFAQAFTSSSYACFFQADAGDITAVQIKSSGTIEFRLSYTDGAPGTVVDAAGANGATFNFVVYGTN